MTKRVQSSRKGSNKGTKATGGKFREARMLLFLGLPVILVALVLAAVANANDTSGRTAADDSQLIREDSPALGPSDAPVTLVEFLDPECESCRAMHPVVKDLLATYDGQLRLVVRYFPLHGNSVLAASATEAAGLQGKYWEMQNLLFERQSEWGEQQTSQEERFVDYAEQLGLNTDQFIADMNRPEFRAKIQRDQVDGEALGVDGTPTFFLNGVRIDRLNYEVIVNAIESSLRR